MAAPKRQRLHSRRVPAIGGRNRDPQGQRRASLLALLWKQKPAVPQGAACTSLAVPERAERNGRFEGQNNR